MPNRGDRGGTKTRAHIAAVATELFLAHGFDAVTIAEVATAAGVSKVTVFSHFERKEDLLLDRLPEIAGMVHRAISERPEGCNPIDALRRAALALIEQRHPLSGLCAGNEQFLRTIVSSPALIARLRTFEQEIETKLATLLRQNGLSGDSNLTAALIVAAYRVVSVETVRLRLNDVVLSVVADDHKNRMEAAFEAITHGMFGVEQQAGA